MLDEYKGGHNTYGNNNESEVLFPRNTSFVVNNIVYDANGIPTIYLTEVTDEQATVGRRKTQEDVSGDHSGESRPSYGETDTRKMQRLSAQSSQDRKMQSSISRRNIERNINKRNELQRVQTEVISQSDRQQHSASDMDIRKTAIH